MKKHKHIIHLEGFEMKNGTIPFSVLMQIVENLTKVSAGTLRVLMDGYSQKRGKQPDWLEKSIDFDLSALKPGSTILEVHAPKLKDSITQAQLPLEFDNIKMDDVFKFSAVDLAMLAYEQAFSENGDVFLLDKPLLKNMQKFKGIFNNNEASFKISGYGNKRVIINKEGFKKIKKLESKTAPSIKSRLTGKFDLMKHSNGLLEIIIQNKKIRAFLSSTIDLHSIKDYFGEQVTLDGIAHFNPRGQISSFEVSKIRIAYASDKYFKRIPSPITEQLKLMDIAQSQLYQGTKLNKVVGNWPGDDKIGDLLQLLD